MKLTLAVSFSKAHRTLLRDAQGGCALLWVCSRSTETHLHFLTTNNFHWQRERERERERERKLTFNLYW